MPESVVSNTLSAVISKFPVECIVRVTGQKCIHGGCQGQVVGHDKSNKEKPVRVWFGRERDFMFDYPERERIEKITEYALDAPPEGKQKTDPRVVNYAPQDLIICADWSTKTLAARYFSDSYTNYKEPNEPFVSGRHDCDVEGCGHMATKRIITNAFGTAIRPEVCGDCAPKYNGKIIEIFPFKKRPAKAKTIQ